MKFWCISSTTAGGERLWLFDAWLVPLTVEQLEPGIAIACLVVMLGARESGAEKRALAYIRSR